MAKIVALTPKRGRPLKTVLDRKKTLLWAAAVKQVAGVSSLRGLEAKLGDDGVWEGVWARYERGLTAPSGLRIDRIDALLPGTGKYFHADFWRLIEQRKYTWEELYVVADGFPRGLFPELRQQAGFGRICLEGNDNDFLTLAVPMVADTTHGHDALAMILLLIREAELRQDALQYLRALTAWSQAREMRVEHPILWHLHDVNFEYVAAPLLKVRFADPTLDEKWQQFMSAYIGYWHHGELPSAAEFSGIHCVSRFKIFRENRAKRADKSYETQGS